MCEHRCAMFMDRKTEDCQDFSSCFDLDVQWVFMIIPASNSLDTNKVVLKCMERWKRTKVTNTIFKKNRVGGLILLN